MRKPLRARSNQRLQKKQSSSSAQVNTLHLLVAMLRDRTCLAYQALLKAGIDLLPLRNQTLSYITGNMPARLNNLPKPRTFKGFAYSPPKEMYPENGESQSIEAASIEAAKEDSEDLENQTYLQRAERILKQSKKSQQIIDETLNVKEEIPQSFKKDPLLKSLPLDNLPNLPSPLNPAQEANNHKNLLLELAPTLFSCGVDLT